LISLARPVRHDRGSHHPFSCLFFLGRPSLTRLSSPPCSASFHPPPVYSPMELSSLSLPRPASSLSLGLLLCPALPVVRCCCPFLSSFYRLFGLSRFRFVFVFSLLFSFFFVLFWIDALSWNKKNQDEKEKNRASSHFFFSIFMVFLPARLSFWMMKKKKKKKKTARIRFHGFNRFGRFLLRVFSKNRKQQQRSGGGGVFFVVEF